MGGLRRVAPQGEPARGHAASPSPPVAVVVPRSGWGGRVTDDELRELSPPDPIALTEEGDEASGCDRDGADRHAGVCRGNSVREASARDDVRGMRPVRLRQDCGQRRAGYLHRVARACYRARKRSGSRRHRGFGIESTSRLRPIPRIPRPRRTCVPSSAGSPSSSFRSWVHSGCRRAVAATDGCR